MKIKKTVAIVMSLLLFCSIAYSQETAQANAGSAQDGMNHADRHHFIGSSLFILFNLAPGDPPNFFQLNYGYDLTDRDALFTELITWTYYEPLGTYGDSDEMYPGKVRALGLGVGYQRFHWKNLYSTLQVTPFLQAFYDSSDDKIQNGFQLYLQTRLGYRFEFFDHRWFVEPSLACNYWPVNTNFPDSFEDVEGDSPNYFLFEPGLNFGFRF